MIPRKSRFKGILFLSIIIILILIFGYLEVLNNNNDSQESQSTYNHVYWMRITPYNLSENASKSYSVGVYFLIPKEDPYYYFNSSSFGPGYLEKEIVFKNDSAYLRLTCIDNRSIGFQCKYSDLETYNSKFTDDFYSADGPFESLWVWYNGSYEYLEIEYTEIDENHGSSGWIRKASCNVKLYSQGWNVFDTIYEEEHWTD
jgi:hypothetical protein